MSVDPTLVVDSGTVFSVAGVLYVLSALVAAVHVLLNKHAPGSAFSWLGLIILSPFFGVTIYWLFGINRIKRRVRAEMRERSTTDNPELTPARHSPPEVEQPWLSVMHSGLAIHHAPYVEGNSVMPLRNGTEAYPAMCQAIREAEHSVVLSSYIFQYDKVGKQFVDELSAAHDRGVAVHVLIDGFGIGYGWSFDKSDRVLRKRGVATARFLSTFSPKGTRFINLRNHRKILSVDGKRAFVGGMNIRAGNLLDGKTLHQTQDMHFVIEGPVLDQINAVFEDDWQFATGDTLSLPRFDSAGQGLVTCRALVDGPDDGYKILQMSIVTALNAAQRYVGIVTPYFLPDDTVLQSLQLAVLRGVKVELILPVKNNLWFVDWAMRANMATLLEYGINVYRSPRPFDHSKLFIVDDVWSLIGSSNWDARSFELNFEINIECHDAALNQQLVAVVADKRDASQLVTDASASLPARLRNNFFRLFSPYL